MQKRKTYQRTKFPDRTLVEAVRALARYWPQAERDDVSANRTIRRGVDEQQYDRDSEFLAVYNSNDVEGACFSKWDSGFGLRVTYDNGDTQVNVTVSAIDQANAILQVFDRSLATAQQR